MSRLALLYAGCHTTCSHRSAGSSLLVGSETPQPIGIKQDLALLKETARLWQTQASFHAFFAHADEVTPGEVRKFLVSQQRQGVSKSSPSTTAAMAEAFQPFPIWPLACRRTSGTLQRQGSGGFQQRPWRHLHLRRL
jgi:hypothetical protein